MTTGASTETTLELWASLLRREGTDVTAVKQGTCYGTGEQFSGRLLGDERHKACIARLNLTG